MTIRTATKKDFESIKALIKLYPKQLMQTNLPKPGSFFVALEDGKIIGCCALDIYSKRIAEIRSLAVKKNYQGRGVGTQLIGRCLKKAKQKKIYEVFSVTGAVKLFGKFGFDTFNMEKYAVLKVM